MTLRDFLRPATHTARSLVGTAGLSDRFTAMEGTLAAGSATTARALAGLDEISARLAAVEDAVAAAAAATAQVAGSVEAVSSRLSAQDAARAPAAEAARPVEPPAPRYDVNYLLHESRGALLRGMPPGARRLLSAGCSGTWYFDWISQTYGDVPEHLGIEFYETKPDDLPRNVTWIANTASDMSAVEAGSCDLVFSGQNLEHLWPEEVAGFALEAARVLKTGGHLVVDSPNRLVTAVQTWSHPQHTIELTPEEAVHLVTLAGFDVTEVHGIWLCRDARDGAILPFDPNLPCPGWSVTERLLLARGQPDNAFIWWVEAVRTGRQPDAAAVHDFMAGLFRRHWPERVQRLLVPPGHTIQASPEGDWVLSAPGQGGATMYGPYMPLKKGRHRVTWTLQTPSDGTAPVAVCEVVAEGFAEALARHEVLPGEREVTLEFALPDTTFGLQFRCLSMAGPGFSVLRRVNLEEYLSGPGAA